jgi:hypothetical protein
VVKGGLQDSSDNALAQEWDIAVDQPADPFVGQLQVCQKLGLLNRQQFLHGFQFPNDFVLHEEIDLVTTAASGLWTRQGCRLAAESSTPEARVHGKGTPRKLIPEVRLRGGDGLQAPPRE